MYVLNRKLSKFIELSGTEVGRKIINRDRGTRITKRKGKGPGTGKMKWGKEGKSVGGLKWNRVSDTLTRSIIHVRHITCWEIRESQMKDDTGYESSENRWNRVCMLYWYKPFDWQTLSLTNLYSTSRYMLYVCY